MEMMLEFMKMVLPAAIVLVAMYLTVKAFVNRDFELAQKEYDTKLSEIKLENAKAVLPVRLQAYERLCLLLERISLNNLIVRVSDPEYTAGMLQQRLLFDVRDEFSHNLSQQLYVSDNAWLLVKRTQEEVVTIINKAAERTDRNGRGIDLAKNIFEEMMTREANPCDITLKFLKDELRQMM